MPWAYYPIFIGTVASIVSLSLLAKHEYSTSEVRTLSQLGSGHSKALQQFRTILWVCGTLITITMLFFLVPRLHSVILAPIWLLTYVCEVLLGVVPDHKGWQSKVHNILAYGMALGFLFTAIYFSYKLTGLYRFISLSILLGMILTVALTARNRKHFLFYELGYIYLSHIGIVIATLAVR